MHINERLKIVKTPNFEIVTVQTDSPYSSRLAQLLQAITWCLIARKHQISSQQNSRLQNQLLIYYSWMIQHSIALDPSTRCENAGKMNASPPFIGPMMQLQIFLSSI